MSGLKKIKVLHVIGGLKAAGAETAVVNWLRTIDRNKYQFDFVVHVTDNFYSAEVKKLGSKIYYLPNPEKNLISWIRTFERLLKEHKYDIVHSHLFYFNGIVLRSAKKMNVPVRISHAHNEKSRVDASMVRKLYQRLSKYLILKYATNLIGCSKKSLESLHLKTKSHKSKSDILHYGIDLKEFDVPISKKALRKKYGLSSSANIFLHIGRFAPVKNHQFLLEIFREIIGTEQNSLLILVGEGILKRKIEKMVKLYQLEKKVLFWGTTKNVSELMGLSDLLIFPSLFEGLPVTLIEAQSSRLPCLVSSRVSKEIDAKIGLISFKNIDKDQKSWANHALGLIKKPRPLKTYIKIAMTNHCFDINSVASKLTSIYARETKKKI